MKHKLLILWLISISVLLTPTITYGESSTCPIKNETAKSLTNYIKNLRKAVTNTNKSLLWKIDKKDTGKLNVTWNEVTRIYNDIINWDWFYTDFSYYLTFPMLNDLPIAIDRDLSILENETDWLRNYLETIVSKWYSWVELTSDEVCDWVKNCNLEWDTINIVWQLIKNNTQITTLYKQIVTNPKQEHSLDVILTEETSSEFVTQLTNSYWKDTISDCNKLKGEGGEADSFWQRIDDAKEAILLNNELWKDWIKKWKDAWKLLVWSSDNKDYATLEHDLLAKELSKQWLSVNSQKIMLDNLAEFNSDSHSMLDNNFIQNSFEQIIKAWVKVKDWFNEATKNLLDWEDTKEINNEASVWISKLLNSTQKTNITESIKKNIDLIYREHIEYASIESYSTVKLQADVIKMHDKIKNSSEILRRTCELAVKVCNDQWKWKWNCWSCK
jgi:hypothetical protein